MVVDVILKNGRLQIMIYVMSTGYYFWFLQHALEVADPFSSPHPLIDSPQSQFKLERGDNRLPEFFIINQRALPAPNYYPSLDFSEISHLGSIDLTDYHGIVFSASSDYLAFDTLNYMEIVFDAECVN